MTTMSFQPLIVVILLVFFVLMALAMFLWFLISPGVAASPKSLKAKSKKDAKPAKRKQAFRGSNPAIKTRAEPVRQTAAIQPKKLRLKEKPELKADKKPDLKYIEVRPEPVKRNLLSKKPKDRAIAHKAAKNEKKTTSYSRDNFRGLNASKEESKKMDPFDSFVEASKRLD